MLPYSVEKKSISGKRDVPLTAVSVIYSVKYHFNCSILHNFFFFFF